MSSEAFQAFEQSFAAHSANMEDLDLGALARLGGAERDEAQRMLVAILDRRDNDPRVPRALASLGTSAALAAMRKALADYPANETKASLAGALWRLEKHPGAVDALAEILGRSSIHGTRAAALTTLEEIPGDRPAQLLAEAARHPDRLSRQVAESALLRRLGLYDRRTAPEVKALRDRLKDGDPQALAELQKLARG